MYQKILICLKIIAGYRGLRNDLIRLPAIRCEFREMNAKYQMQLKLRDLASPANVLYADDICLLAPSASAMQSLLDVCYEYGTDNDILFNPIKSVCTVFKPKAYKRFTSKVFIGDDHDGTKRPSSISYYKMTGQGGIFPFCISRMTVDTATVRSF